MLFLGVDEAGRGPALGPMVVAGMVSDDRKDLLSMGVRDSKELTRKRREMLFGELSGSDGYCILSIPASTIDLARETMTMNRLEVVCFSSIIISLLGGEEFIHPSVKGRTEMALKVPDGTIERVIMDAADVNEERFGEEISGEVSRFTKVGGTGFLSRHKADRDYPIVGAASILAKVTRDRRIEEISMEVGRNVGSGYPSDPVTISFLKDWIHQNGDLPPFARRSWETCRKLVREAGQSALGDFDLHGDHTN